MRRAWAAFDAAPAELVRRARRSESAVGLAEVTDTLASAFPLGPSVSHGDFAQLLTELRRARARNAACWPAAAAEAAVRAPALSAGQAAQVAFALAFGPLDGIASSSSSSSSSVEPSQHRVEPPPVEPWTQLAARLTAVERDKVSLSDLRTAAAAFARVRYASDEFLMCVSDHLAAAVMASEPSEADSRAVSGVADALASLGRPLAKSSQEDAWNRLAGAAIRSSQAFCPPHHLAALCGALALAEVPEGARNLALPALTAALLQEGNLSAMDVHGLLQSARFLSAAATAAGTGSGVVQKALSLTMEVAAGCSEGLSAKDAALLLNALARGLRKTLLLPEDHLVASSAKPPPDSEDKTGFLGPARALAERMAEHLRSGQASPRDAANALDALGRLSLRHQRILEGLAEYLPANLARFGPQDVVGVAVALGRLQESDEALLLAMAGLISRDLQRFSMGQLAHVYTAFARLRLNEVRTLQRVLDRCADPQAWKVFQPGDAVALLAAWGRLRAAHAGAFEAASRVLLEESPDGKQVPLECLGPTDLQEVVSAYARARWAYKPMLTAVADATSLDGIVPFEVTASVLVALCRLRWQHPALQHRALAAMLAAENSSRVPSLTMWAQVLHASVFLDTHGGMSPGCRLLWQRCCEVVARRLTELVVLDEKDPKDVVLGGRGDNLTLDAVSWQGDEEDGDDEDNAQGVYRGRALA
ncbi:unnamed protein product, partial [Polarella glacialis]